MGFRIAGGDRVHQQGPPVCGNREQAPDLDRIFRAFVDKATGGKKNAIARNPEVPLGSRSLVRATSGADRWFEIKSLVHHKLVNSLTSEQLRDLTRKASAPRSRRGRAAILDESPPHDVGEREKLIEEILDESSASAHWSRCSRTLHLRHHGQRFR